jgi:hypothetical protein
MGAGRIVRKRKAGSMWREEEEMEKQVVNVSE